MKLLLTTIAAVVLATTAFAGPIHDAVEKGDIAAVQAELNKGVDVDTKGGWMNGTPLHNAADEGGHKEIAELLIAEGADVNAKDDELGGTPLHNAASWGHTEIVELLIANGAEVSAKEMSGYTPLHLAVFEAYKEVAELLIENGADVNAKGGEFGGTPLHLAISEGNNEIAKLLIDKGADVNAEDEYGRVPLNLAALSGRKVFAELLIAKGADVNAKDYGGNTPLDVAIGHKHPEIADLLREHGGKIGEELPPATVFEAVNRVDLQGVKDLLAKGADVNAKHRGLRSNLSWSSPLHLAVRKGHKEITELLIANGADMNAMETFGTTPLHNAIEGGQKEFVELLIDNGADVNATQLGCFMFCASSPLNSAIRGDHKEIAELLIAKGANVNAKDYRGGTPLHRATGEGHMEIVELLIVKGADVNSKNKDDKTPLDWAEEVDEFDSPELKAARKEIADLLRKHGGKTGEELKTLMPRLAYGRGLFDFTFTAKNGMTYVVEVTQDFKQWGELETIKGTGKQVKFIDPRQPLVPFKRNFYRVKVVE